MGFLFSPCSPCCAATPEGLCICDNQNTSLVLEILDAPTGIPLVGLSINDSHKKYNSDIKLMSGVWYLWTDASFGTGIIQGLNQWRTPWYSSRTGTSAGTLPFNFAPKMNCIDFPTIASEENELEIVFTINSGGLTPCFGQLTTPVGAFPIIYSNYPLNERFNCTDTHDITHGSATGTFYYNGAAYVPSGIRNVRLEDLPFNVNGYCSDINYSLNAEITGTGDLSKLSQDIELRIIHVGQSGLLFSGSGGVDLGLFGPSIRPFGIYFNLKNQRTALAIDVRQDSFGETMIDREVYSTGVVCSPLINSFKFPITNTDGIFNPFFGSATGYLDISITEL